MKTICPNCHREYEAEPKLRPIKNARYDTNEGTEETFTDDRCPTCKEDVNFEDIL